MATRMLIRILPLLLLALGASVAIAQECVGPEARECVPTTNDCAPGDDFTSVSVQLGGQGSTSSNDGDCGGWVCDDPGRLGDGTLGQAIMIFEYTRSTTPGEGQLVVKVQNTTCTKSQVFDFWFNVGRENDGTPRVTALSLTGTSSSHSPRRANDWQANLDPDGCENNSQYFGYFDVEIMNADNTPPGEIWAESGVFEQVTFFFDVEGAADLTACDFASQASRVRGQGGSCLFDDTEKTTFAAAKFQRGLQGGSGTIGPCDGEGDLLVELKTLRTSMGDGQVRLSWETLSEIDTVGFQIYRTDLATGRSELLTESLIPSRGGPTEGGRYEYLDDTAVNGVQYSYFLTDVDMYGITTTHFPREARPNPADSGIRLVTPYYDARLQAGRGGRMVFATDQPGGYAVEISSDPTFSSPAQKTLLRGTDWKGDLKSARFGKRTARKLGRLAGEGHGYLYWRVVQTAGNRFRKNFNDIDRDDRTRPLGNGDTSPTYRVSFE